MSSFDARYWNLSQAAAWVVYRRRDLVEALADQSDHGFASLRFYPLPDGTKATPAGSLADLEGALHEGRVTALGRRTSSPERVEVPAHEWADLSIRPSRVVRHDPLAGLVQPWRDLLFESAGLRRLWRGTDEVAGRRKYDPEASTRSTERCARSSRTPRGTASSARCTRSSPGSMSESSGLVPFEHPPS